MISLRIFIFALFCEMRKPYKFSVQYRIVCLCFGLNIYILLIVIITVVEKLFIFFGLQVWELKKMLFEGELSMKTLEDLVFKGYLGHLPYLTVGNYLLLPLFCSKDLDTLL